MSEKVLVINSGSSSIKFELFQMPECEPLAQGMLERIGEQQSRLRCTIGGTESDLQQPVADHAVGLELIVKLLSDPERGGLSDIAEITAVGHRVVHGGEAFTETVRITDEVVAAIEQNVELAPLHNPPNLLGIEVARKLLPEVPQVAVFDTAFHQSLPREAFLYAVPHDWYTENRVRRYGFHGTSHRYVAARAASMLGKPLEQANLITAHLGNGASITAIRDGQSVDTSMGLTPLEGLVMGTRSGDLDPALLSYIERARGLSGAEVDKLLNKKSGLLGLSGVSNDLRAVSEAEQQGNDRAAMALEVYCYRIRKYVGAYTAVLGQVDALVFTAGVGENAAQIRQRALEGMGPLGYQLDPAKNDAGSGERDIAADDAPIRVLVIPTNEELMIAQDTYAVVFPRA
jgi:acetate kinase